MGVVKSSRHGAYADVQTHISLFFSFLYFFKAFIAQNIQITLYFLKYAFTNGPDKWWLSKIGWMCLRVAQGLSIQMQTVQWDHLHIFHYAT